jgi:hypothetical protein
MKPDSLKIGGVQEHHETTGQGQNTFPPAESTAKTIQRASLPLESIHNIHSRHSLAPSMLSVSDRITDDILQEDLENATSLLVNQATDPLYTSPPSQPPDSWLGDALDVVPQHLPVSLRSSLSKTLSSLSSSRHDIRQQNR